MIPRSHKLIILTAAIGFFSSAAFADPSCTVWMWQEGGWYWQQCVNDDGTTHCYHAENDKGRNAYEIDCAK